MSHGAELWKQIHGSFEYHRKAQDSDAQSGMDRVAMKCLGTSERRSFNPSNCTVHAEILSVVVLNQLVIYHTRSDPKRMDGPIVVLRIGGRGVVIDQT
jgi:hypothetical protein